MSPPPPKPDSNEGGEMVDANRRAAARRNENESSRDGDGDGGVVRPSVWELQQITATQRVSTFTGEHRHRRRILTVKKRDQTLPVVIISILIIVLMSIFLYLYGQVVQCRLSKESSFARGVATCVGGR
jgi:hypothetical protein